MAGGLLDRGKGIYERHVARRDKESGNRVEQLERVDSASGAAGSAIVSTAVSRTQWGLANAAATTAHYGFFRPSCVINQGTANDPATPKNFDIVVRQRADNITRHFVASGMGVDGGARLGVLR